MCLIIIKPPDIDFPQEPLLKYSFLLNPDGIGFAFDYNGRVQIHKGYMNFAGFIKDYNQTIENIPDLKNHTMVIHFRRASRGKVKPELTHPFPISNDMEILTQAHLSAPFALFHNGTIKMLDKEVKKSKGLKSDTLLFVEKYLYLLSQNQDWFNNPANKALLELLVGDSRVAILSGQGYMLIGQFHKHNGLLFSKDMGNL